MCERKKEIEREGKARIENTTGGEEGGGDDRFLGVRLLVLLLLRTYKAQAMELYSCLKKELMVRPKLLRPIASSALDVLDSYT